MGAQFSIFEDGNGIAIEVTGIGGSSLVGERVREALLVPGDAGVSAMIMPAGGDGGGDHKRVVGIGYKPGDVYPALRRALYLDLNRRRKRSEAHHEGLLVSIRDPYRIDPVDDDAKDGAAIPSKIPPHKRLELFRNSVVPPNKPSHTIFKPTPALVGQDGRWAQVPDGWFTNCRQAFEHCDYGAGENVWVSAANANYCKDRAIVWTIHLWSEPVVVPKRDLIRRSD